MEIGGIDITIQIKVRPDTVLITLNKMKELWPNAYFQDHNSEKYFPIDSEEVQKYIKDTSECVLTEQLGFFVYENEQAAKDWEIGIDKNTMLYFLIDAYRSDEHYLTFVCDEEDVFVKNLFKYLSEKLQ